jgi:DNA-binding MarR family transcriptional regulator
VTLAHYPGQSVGDLGRTLGLTHSGAVRLADRLEAGGLVRRTRPGPGRTLALHLTEPGRAAALRVLAQRGAALEQLVRRLEPGEIAAFDRLAGRLLAAITTDRASAHRLCRLCDEPLCAAGAGCPVDHAARA